MMNSDNAIEVKNIKKTFKVYFDKSNQLKEKALFWKRNRYEKREVLKDISFSVKKGEAIGLIGHNGCGKSTTLKLLTRIMYPDSGTVEMKGRVSALIELGAGFHPDMSGRENIYTNAAIFGLTKKEIDAKVFDIIAFSELEEFIDNPVRTYSSGMYMRLAFAVAINVDADILLIDEILAVGDAAFQAKCFNKLKEIKAQGTTIVIVSHSLGQIEQICERSIWLDNGLVREEGNPFDVDAKYIDYITQKQVDKSEKNIQEVEISVDAEAKDVVDSSSDEILNEISEYEKNKPVPGDNRFGSFDGYIREVNLYNSNKEKISTLTTGDKVTIEICYELENPVNDACFGIAFFRIDGTHVYGTNTHIDRIKFDLKKSGKMSVEIDKLLLLSGKYTLDVALQTDAGVNLDYWRSCMTINIFSKITDVGVSRIEHRWKI